MTVNEYQKLAMVTLNPDLSKRDVLINGKPISDAELKELVGHKPIEVAGGALVGLVVAGIYILALAGRA